MRTTLLLGAALLLPAIALAGCATPDESGGDLADCPDDTGGAGRVDPNAQISNATNATDGCPDDAEDDMTNASDGSNVSVSPTY